MGSAQHFVIAATLLKPLQSNQPHLAGAGPDNILTRPRPAGMAAEAELERRDRDQMAGETDSPEGPLSMQFFSTWEVRKVPANCVPR